MTARVEARELVLRLERALVSARGALAPFLDGVIGPIGDKGGGDPITAADHAVDAVLRAELPAEGEGWLSEESVDDPARLGCARVWIVDPLDGTREFVAGIPEWAVSIGLTIDGRPVAGAVLNPMTDERFVGVVGVGLWRNGEPAAVSPRRELRGARVLASRSEVGRGDWRRHDGDGLAVTPTGSIAYKLARVAAGLADATWSLRPKNEWDVAGGAALVLAGGGVFLAPDGSEPRFNQPRTLQQGPIAANAELASQIRRLLSV